MFSVFHVWLESFEQRNKVKWFRATPDTMLDSRVEIKRRKSTSQTTVFKSANNGSSENTVSFWRYKLTGCRLEKKVKKLCGRHVKFLPWTARNRLLPLVEMVKTESGMVWVQNMRSAWGRWSFRDLLYIWVEVLSR